jgi:hypothetical protein
MGGKRGAGPTRCGGAGQFADGSGQVHIERGPVLGIVTATPPAVLSPTESVKLTS